MVRLSIDLVEQQLLLVATDVAVDLPPGKWYHLELRLCQLQDISLLDSNKAAETFPNMKKIVYLNVSLNDLRFLSPLRAIPNLCYIDCSTNHLCRLDELAAFSGLRSICASHNHLTTLAGLENLHSLTSLNASENELTRMTVVAQLTSLQELCLDGNQITALEGLRPLTALRSLSIQRNQIVDAAQIVFLESLTNLNLARNQIHDLDAVCKSLQALTALTDLKMQVNPVQQVTAYRVRILQQPSITRLDGMPITAFTRKHVAQLQHKGDVRELTAQAASAYAARIEAEKQRANRTLTELKARQKAVEDALQHYSTTMQSELHECMAFLRFLEEHPEAGREVDLDQLRAALSAAEAARWREMREQLERDRVTWVQENVAARSHTKTFQQKMYELSLQQPDVWRAIKEQELKLRMMEGEYQDREQKALMDARHARRDELVQSRLEAENKLLGPAHSAILGIVSHQMNAEVADRRRVLEALTRAVTKMQAVWRGAKTRQVVREALEQQMQLSNPHTARVSQVTSAYESPGHSARQSAQQSAQQSANMSQQQSGQQSRAGTGQGGLTPPQSHRSQQLPAVQLTIPMPDVYKR